MSDLLDTAAVGSRNGAEAGEILRAYLETAPVMVLSHAPGAALEKNPKGADAGDRLIEP